MHDRGLLLILDDEKNDLAEVSLQLIRVGVDAMHAGSLDEADLLARQEGSRIRGVIVPAEIADQRIDEILETIGSLTGVGIRGLALLGPRPHGKRVEALRERGIPWRLWQPYEDRDLRFVAWSLVWAGTHHNLRVDRRVPTALPAVAAHRGRSVPVLIGDLSASGAYVETADPNCFPAGDKIGLEIALPGGPVEVLALVRWVAQQDAGPVRARPLGCGVEFIDPPNGCRLSLQEHVDVETSRFSL